MSKEKAGLALLTGSASLLFLAACGSGGDGGEQTTLEGAESSLTDTQVTREEARAAAKACFDVYGGCGASGYDGHECREELEECLRYVGEPAPECDEQEWDDHDGELDEHHHHKGKHHKGKHHKGKHHCHPSPIPGAALHECREEVEHSLEAGDDVTVVATNYDQCVLDAFADGIAKLCAEIDELCANANAPVETCDRITTACDTP